MDWVRQSGDESLRSEVMKTAMSALAAKDLSGAMAQARALPAGEERESRHRGLPCKAVRNRIRKATARLLDELPSGAARDDAAVKVCQAWAASDPHAALDWLFTKAPPAKGSENSKRIDGIVNQWLASAPQEAVEWARSMPAGENRNAALGSVVAGLARSDLKLAGSLFAELPPESQGDGGQGAGGAIYAR